MARRGENIYKRKDGRWEARIPKPDGKYRYIYAKSYKEVREKKKSCQENQMSREKNGTVMIGSVPLLFESWLKNDAVQQVKPSTYEYYYYCINNYIIPFFSKEKSQCLNFSSVNAFVHSVRNNDALSESYKRKILSVFKTALKKAAQGLPEYSLILEAVKLPAVHTSEVQVFSTREQRLIEETVLHYPDRRALGLLLCLYTGIRLGELCALKWNDIDFEARAMSIAKTISRTKNFQEEGNKTTLLVRTPKSHKSVRKIPIPAFLIQLSEEYRAYENQDLYFLTGSEAPLDPRTYQKLYKKVLAAAGVRDRKFHAIRHTFATRALELGVDIKTLSEILGHSNVSITLNIYGHSLMEQKILAIEKLNNMHATFRSGSVFAVSNFVRSTEKSAI
ncbi:MAG TPA: tyrosine-type recombinase/integrase [Clostridia bacterium]|nr:tyrosine-type recombinase/integrase [Clostridia bacterium]